MAKNKFYHIEAKEKELIFKDISNKTGIPAFAVEKDWWVKQALAIVFEMEVGQHLVFKGGTSLSKAWKLIERFSEDIDLALDRAFLGFEGDISGKAVKKLRKASNEFLTKTFLPALQQKFEEKGFGDIKLEMIEESQDESKEEDIPIEEPVKIFINYKEITTHPAYIAPRVQLEIGSRSLREPFLYQKLGSLLDETLPYSDFAEEPIRIPVVNPDRTFLEKVFLLHEEFHKPIEKIRVHRLSRHIYDVYHLSKEKFADKAIHDQELYETIVAHRHKFSRVGQVDYNSLNPIYINPIPITEVIGDWEKDYQRMKDEMIYEANPPTFKELIETLEVLREKISKVDWTFELKFPIPNS